MKVSRKYYYKVTRKLGLKVALRAFFTKGYPASILYDIFDKYHCGVCIYDAEGIKLRSDWIYETQSPQNILKYRIDRSELTDEVKKLMEKLETTQLL